MIPESFRQMRALTAVAETLAWAGQPGQAGVIAHSITNEQDRKAALTAVATALGTGGTAAPSRKYRPQHH